MKFFAGILFILAISNPANAETKTASVTDFQREFVETINNYSAQYEAAPNDLKKSTTVRKRLEAISKLKGDTRNVSGWYGTIENMGTTSDGNAYLVIRPLAENITFSTWNNKFSDPLEKTLIKNGSPLYEKISEMSEGNVVMFSGSIGQPKNMTEKGKMTDPDFLFKFTAVEKVADSVAR